jgi:hypothetical protein
VFKLIKLILLAVFIVSDFNVQAHADIYRYIDPNEVVHMTDVPLPGYKKFVAGKKNNPSPDNDVVQREQKDDFYGYYIQMGPFQNIKEAEKLRIRLQHKGIEAFSFKQRKGKFAVWFGNFSTQEKAQAEAKNLVSEKIIGKYFISSPQEAYPVQPIELNKSKLTREAKKMANVLKSMHSIMKFRSECVFKAGEMANIQDSVACSMYFPGDYAVGNVPMRYVHDIEAFTQKTAVSFTRTKSPVSFVLQALVKVDGDYVPLCYFMYVKEFDSLTASYNYR